MDIAKYVATAVVISSFLGEFTQKWVFYVGGILTVSICFFIGFYSIKKK